jgi:hypothetical protein
MFSSTPTFFDPAFFRRDFWTSDHCIFYMTVATDAAWPDSLKGYYNRYEVFYTFPGFLLAFSQQTTSADG